MAPSGDTVKVANLFNPRQATEGIAEVKFVFDVTGNLKVKPRRLFGETARKLVETEPRESRAILLSGWKWVIHGRPVLLPNTNRSGQDGLA